jgi:hypothetical protein
VLDGLTLNVPSPLLGTILVLGLCLAAVFRFSKLYGPDRGLRLGELLLRRRAVDPSTSRPLPSSDAASGDDLDQMVETPLPPRPVPPPDEDEPHPAA